MRPSFHRAAAPQGLPGPHLTALRDPRPIVELFLGVFRRDVLGFYPQCRLELDLEMEPRHTNGPEFHVAEHDGQSLAVEIFGLRHILTSGRGHGFSRNDLRLVNAVGAVAGLRYHHLFQMAHAPRLELFRGGSEDHYVAAYIEPELYSPKGTEPSRIASTVQTLRTAALSTYENRRVSTGALLIGDDCKSGPKTATDALPYGVELTSLKSIHRLCDGRRTLFRVDRQGRLAEIVDIERFAAEMTDADGPEVPCSQAYVAHARATRSGGHVCLVLSPNQEIKLFAGGVQAFVFAHGRWRMLDPATKFAMWCEAVGNPEVATSLFQAALDLAESRQGGLFVVVDHPQDAVGRLISPHDIIEDDTEVGPPPELMPGDPLAKRALHYLARGRRLVDLDPAVLESLAGLDGALVVDRPGRLLAFGAILRHDASSLPTTFAAEGARTTAALVASRFGPVLKVSEDGIISCFLDGSKAWDL